MNEQDVVVNWQPVVQALADFLNFWLWKYLLAAYILLKFFGRETWIRWLEAAGWNGIIGFFSRIANGLRPGTIDTNEPTRVAQIVNVPWNQAGGYTVPAAAPDASPPSAVPVSVITSPGVAKRNPDGSLTIDGPVTLAEVKPPSEGER